MDYLSDGLRYEIAQGLSLTPGLRVAGNTNLAKYKNATLDVRQAGRELGVASVLSGKIAHDGKSILLDLELTDTRSGLQLWSGQFEQPDAGLSTFRHEITGRIAAKLGARVSDSTRPAARNPEAYEAYLAARYHFIKRSKADMAMASTLCEQAIQLDPKFAEAWSLLAASLGFTPGMYNSLSPEELYSKTRGAIAKAIEIDPNLPEVHLTLGAIKFFQERDWPVAEQELRRAIALNPNDSQAHLFLAILMRVLGRATEERRYIHRARELDPLSPVIANHVAWTEYFQGHDDVATAELKTALAVDADYSSNHTLIGYIALRRKQYPQAIAAFQKAVMTAAGQASLGDLGYALAVTGDKPAALKILQKLEPASGGYTPAGAIAWIYLGLGDKDQAFKWFTQASKENYQWLNYIHIWRVYDPLRSDPRLDTLIHSLKLDRPN